MHDGDVRILIECKKYGSKLSSKHASQLFRYFSVTGARIAILTNGELYQFYTDLDKPNQMDSKPFLEVDLADPDEQTTSELTKMTKSAFDLNSIISAAGDLKYLNQLKKRIDEEFKDPSDDLVKFFTSKVYDGIITQKVKLQFAETLKKAFKQFLNEKINSRLKNALQDNTAETETEDNEGAPVEPDNGIVTSEEEIEGYNIIKAIVRGDIDINRMSHRDTKSYFGILIDDNNRKPLCRLHFNRMQKYIGIFDNDKNEERIPIDNLNELFDFSNQLKATAKSYNEE